LAVVVSGAFSRMLPWSIPTPLVQILLGCLIGLSTSYSVSLDPELFLLLFLPPLLFLDGWRIPKDELFKDVSTVVELALGLVLTTVIGMGLFINWMIPAMPLAVAFALAAVVSPTDPIAVSAIAVTQLFGTTVRTQMGAIASEVGGNDATATITKAKTAGSTAATTAGKKRSLDTYGNQTGAGSAGTQ